jgi:hypothetical protein
MKRKNSTSEGATTYFQKKKRSNDFSVNGGGKAVGTAYAYAARKQEAADFDVPTAGPKLPRTLFGEKRKEKQRRLRATPL